MRTSANIKTSKHPKHLQRKCFCFIHQEKLILNQRLTKKLTLNYLCCLPKNSRGYVRSTNKSGNHNELFCGKHCLGLEILNKSFEDTIQIKEEVIGFFVTEPKKIKFQHASYIITKKRKKTENIMLVRKE